MMKQQPFYLNIGGQERPALFTKKSHKLFTDITIDVKCFPDWIDAKDVLALVTILLQDGSIVTKTRAYWWEQVAKWLEEANNLDEILKVIYKQGLAYWSHGNRQN